MPNFVLPSFLLSHQGTKKPREVIPGLFWIWAILLLEAQQTGMLHQQAGEFRLLEPLVDR